MFSIIFLHVRTERRNKDDKKNDMPLTNPVPINMTHNTLLTSVLISNVIEGGEFSGYSTSKAVSRDFVKSF